jgi:hypothetical protein
VCSTTPHDSVLPLIVCGLQGTLTYPDERQLARGIQSTGVPAALKTMLDCLVWESTRTEEGYVIALQVVRIRVFDQHIRIE